MPIGLNTFVLASPFATEQSRWFPIVKQWGYDCIEIAVEDPALIDAKAMAKALDDSGLRCNPVSGAFGGDRDLRGSPAEQQAGLDYLSRLFDIAGELGAQTVSGPAYSRTGRAEAYSPEERRSQRDLVARHLATAAQDAQSRSLTLAIEALNRFETDFVNTCQQALDLLDAVGSPALKVHLDTFHMNIEETDPAAAIRLAGDRLGHFHISSSHRGIPGEDRIEWDRIAEALVEIDYQGDLVLESFSPEVEAIARACSIWRPLYPSAEAYATRGLAFAKNTFASLLDKDTDSL